MNLEKLYEGIYSRLKQIDFNSLWNGFHLYKFALYNDKECFFDGDYIEKTDVFCANTSIMYSEIKILIGCTDEEKTLIYETHNETQYMKGILIER